MTGLNADAEDNNESEPITEHDDYERVRELGCSAGVGALWSLQDLGCEIDFRMPCGQMIVVTAPGDVDYWLEQVSSYSGDRFRMGMELDGERVETKNPNNMPTNYLTALELLIKIVEHDPQNETEIRPSHVQLGIPVKN